MINVQLESANNSPIHNGSSTPPELLHLPILNNIVDDLGSASISRTVPLNHHRVPGHLSHHEPTRGWLRSGDGPPGCYRNVHGERLTRALDVLGIHSEQVIMSLKDVADSVGGAVRFDPGHAVPGRYAHLTPLNDVGDESSITSRDWWLPGDGDAGAGHLSYFQGSTGWLRNGCNKYFEV